MRTAESIMERLEGIAQTLEHRGQTDIARQIEEVVSELREEGRVVRGPDLMTTGEAAEALGVRSVFTIKRWARDGILDGFQRGGRILVTRESVENMLASPKVAGLRHREADLDAFDASGEQVPPTSWPGRKPWKTNATNSL